MKKDIEWLKEEMDSMHRKRDLDRNPDEWFISKTALLKAIDQLDKPEVLTQEWIDEHKMYCLHSMQNGYFISEELLQNILVPKQELPVIPQFVADWVESRDYYNVYKVLQDLSAPGSPHASKDVRNWIFRNQENAEKFVRAWLDGYTVGEEPKYNVRIKSSFGTVGIFLFKQGDEVLSGDNFKAYHPKEDEFRLTEQEIRGFQNGDVLFERFAVRVEELEENGEG